MVMRPVPVECLIGGGVVGLVQADVGFAGDLDRAAAAEFVDEEGSAFQVAAVGGGSGGALAVDVVEGGGIAEFVVGWFGQEVLGELLVFVEGQSDVGGDVLGELFVLEGHDDLLGDELRAHERQVLDGVLGDDHHPGVVLAGASADQVRISGAGPRVEQCPGFFQDDEAELAAAVDVALGEERDSGQAYQHAVDGDAGALAVAEVGVQVWGVHFFGVGQIEAAGVPDGDVEGDQVWDGQGVIEDALGEFVGGPGLQCDQHRQQVLGEPCHGCVGGRRRIRRCLAGR